ncbi:MAG: class I SAM-dependent methyltransferase [Desulfobacteria bacterium]
MAGHNSPHPTMESFQKINTLYEQYYAAPKEKGIHSHKETEKGFWLSSVSTEVFDLFRTIGLEQFNHFADLGSGDGKVALIASLFTESTGIEFDDELVQRSNQIKEEIGANNLRFKKGDFLEEDLSAYDILFVYPDNPLVRLEQKLLKEFRGDLIVCGGIYPPERLVKKRVVQINNAVFGIYRRGWLSGYFTGRRWKA